MEKSCRRMRRRLISFLCNNRCKVFISFVTMYHFIFFILYQEVDSKFIDAAQVLCYYHFAVLFTINNYQQLYLCTWFKAT